MLHGLNNILSVRILFWGRGALKHYPIKMHIILIKQYLFLQLKVNYSQVCCSSWGLLVQSYVPYLVLHNLGAHSAPLPTTMWRNLSKTCCWWCLVLASYLQYFQLPSKFTEENNHLLDGKGTIWLVHTSDSFLYNHTRICILPICIWKLCGAKGKKWE